MKNLFLFGVIMFIVAVSLIVGNSRFTSAQAQAGLMGAGSVSSQLDSNGLAGLTRGRPAAAPGVPALSNVPHIGSIQVLNGCGVSGAADRMADFLRTKNFDVKDIGNAPSWNYPATMIIARTTDMGLANEIEKFLKTNRVTLIRNNRDGSMYDVTVVVGHDYESKVK